ncbi:hypothetical protein [Chengkuizengella marina]|uniref:Uncharacterized protein n=1 Tax=Chengkuizengella marina TaxID=2507566 RepID=A0A6N9Q7A2_9BACL|nr:hypothetical protein [Chengkuizengella marina]NBI30543.1 hypothetical protein [Chengkuizengella marina]
MKKQMMLILLSCFILLILVGCNEDEPVVEIIEDRKIERASTLTISSSEFIKGDAEVLEAHFDEWQTGKVNLQYTGEEKMMAVSYDIYEKGKLTKSSGTIGTFFMDKYEGKLLISLIDEDKSDLQNYNLGLQISSESSSSYTNRDIPEIQFPAEAARTIWNLNKGITLHDKEEAIVWAYLANVNSIINPVILTDENLKKDYDFAFVIKVNLIDEEDYDMEGKQDG